MVNPTIRNFGDKGNSLFSPYMYQVRDVFFDDAVNLALCWPRDAEAKQCLAHCYWEQQHKLFGQIILLFCSGPEYRLCCMRANAR